MARERGRPAGDWEARKAAIAEAVLEAFQEEGFDGMTMRSVARKAGYTTGVLSHYFRDKSELLQFSTELAFGRLDAEWRELAATLPPMEALRQICLTTLPRSPRRRLDWSLWLNYLARAPWEPAFSAMIETRARMIRALVVDLLDQGKRDGAVAPGIEPDDVADALVVFVEGMGMTAHRQQRRFSDKRQRRILELFLKRVVQSET